MSEISPELYRCHPSHRTSEDKSEIEFVIVSKVFRGPESQGDNFINGHSKFCRDKIPDDRC